METLTENRLAALENALINATAWMLEPAMDDGRIRYRAIRKINTHVQHLGVFKNVELAQVDMRLPSVFADLCERIGKYFHGEIVRCAVDYYRRPSVDLSTDVKAKFQFSDEHRIHRFKAIRPLPDDTGVFIAFDDYQMLHTPEGVNYANRVKLFSLDVPVEWLDAALPGWKERYNIGVALNLPEDELLDFTTSNNAGLSALAAPATLPDSPLYP